MLDLHALAERNLLSVFNQRNQKKRRATLRELWAKSGILWTAEGTYAGHKEVDKAAAGLLRKYPEYSFFISGFVDEIPEAARVSWSFGVEGCAPALTGLDVVVVSGEHIVAVYRFLNGAEM